LRQLFANAFVRTFGSVSIGIVGGIVTNWLVVDLTADTGRVDWSRVTDTPASGALAVYLLAAAVHAYGLYRHDADIMKWNDAEYRRARLYRDLHVDIVRAAKRDLRGPTSPDITDLKRRYGL